MGMIRIPPFKYYFPKTTINWITENIRQLLEDGEYLTLGRYTEQFEKEFATYVGMKHAVAMTSGTAAPEALLRAVGVEGGEVIVPTNTLAATGFAVIHAGGRPVFADIGRDFSIDTEDAAKRLTSNTRVIITVHIGGFVSPRVRELQELAKGRGISLIEDAAHAQGSMLGGEKAGSFGSAAGFSFFSSKVITTGEGRMITTDDDEIARMARLLRDQGRMRGNWVGAIGYNWRMNEFQAIVGITQLRILEIRGERR